MGYLESLEDHYNGLRVTIQVKLDITSLSKTLFLRGNIIIRIDSHLR